MKCFTYFIHKDTSKFRFIEAIIRYYGAIRNKDSR